MIGATLETHEAADLRKHGSDIRQAVGLGSRLVEQLYLFGRQSDETRPSVDLALLIDRMKPVLVQLLRGVGLEIEVTTDRTGVSIEPAQLEQLVLNLCVNAAEAISRPDGRVRIQLRDASADEPLNPAVLVLVVEDNGCGMDAETQAHMFEPYFTRKQGGHGVGLSVVYGIVKRCGGSILVRSTPGEGTTFTLGLPRGAVIRSPR